MCYNIILRAVALSKVLRFIFPHTLIVFFFLDLKDHKMRTNIMIFVVFLFFFFVLLFFSRGGYRTVLIRGKKEMKIKNNKRKRWSQYYFLLFSMMRLKIRFPFFLSLNDIACSILSVMQNSLFVSKQMVHFKSGRQRLCKDITDMVYERRFCDQVTGTADY